MAKKLSKSLTARVAAHDTIGEDVLELRLKNNKTGRVFDSEQDGEVVKVRISRRTALLLAQLIDEEFDMGAGTSHFTKKKGS